MIHLAAVKGNRLQRKGKGTRRPMKGCCNDPSERIWALRPGWKQRKRREVDGVPSHVEGRAERTC